MAAVSFDKAPNWNTFRPKRREQATLWNRKLHYSSTTHHTPPPHPKLLKGKPARAVKRLWLRHRGCCRASDELCHYSAILCVWEFCLLWCLFLVFLVSGEARRGSQILELKLQTVWAIMGLRGLECRFSGRAASFRNHRSISQAAEVHACKTSPKLMILQVWNNILGHYGS